MNRSILITGLLTALTLTACIQPDENPAVVAVPGPAVAVPGPAGPTGATGNQGNTGDTGKKGDTAVIVVPDPPKPKP